jgi:hypothetical protein
MMARPGRASGRCGSIAQGAGVSTRLAQAGKTNAERYPSERLAGEVEAVYPIVMRRRGTQKR